MSGSSHFQILRIVSYYMAMSCRLLGMYSLVVTGEFGHPFHYFLP